MLKVRGASYRPIHLSELNDNVFYGQDKVYSELQFSKCPQLGKEIERGTILLIERVPEANAGYIAPIAVSSPPSTLDVTPAWYHDLVDKIEAKADPAPLPPPAPDMSALLRTLVDKVETLTARVESAPVATAPAQDVSAQIQALHTKLDGMMVSGPGVVETRYTNDVSAKDEVFIPTSTIRVDDLTNNVNLETKSLGQGSSVNEALAQLKLMKKNNGPKS